MLYNYIINQQMHIYKHVQSHNITLHHHVPVTAATSIGAF